MSKNPPQVDTELATARAAVNALNAFIKAREQAAKPTRKAKAKARLAPTAKPHLRLQPGETFAEAMKRLASEMPLATSAQVALPLTDASSKPLIDPELTKEHRAIKLYFDKSQPVPVIARRVGLSVHRVEDLITRERKVRGFNSRVTRHTHKIPKVRSMLKKGRSTEEIRDKLKVNDTFVSKIRVAMREEGLLPAK